MTISTRRLTVLLACAAAIASGDLVLSAQTVFLVDQDRLYFAAQQGAANPPPQGITVLSDLAWTASVASGNWLRLGAGGGGTVVSVSLAGLVSGTYNGSIQIRTSVANKLIPVTLYVTASPPGPLLVVRPSTYAFELLSGGSVRPAASVSFLVRNGGGGTLNWRFTSNPSPWLAIGPSSGSGDGQGTVTIRDTGLPDGTYTGTAVVEAAGSLNATVSLTVTLYVRRGATGCLFTCNPGGSGIVGINKPKPPRICPAAALVADTEVFSLGLPGGNRAVSLAPAGATSSWEASADPSLLTLASTTGGCFSNSCEQLHVTATGSSTVVRTATIFITPRLICDGALLTGEKISLNVTLTPGPPSGFAIDLVPKEISLRPGEDDFLDVVVNRTTAIGNISLSLTAMPSKVRATVTSPGFGNRGSVFVRADPDAPAVTNRLITVVASGPGGGTATGSFTLNVAGQPGISIFAPDAVTLTGGDEPETALLALTRSSFNGSVNVGISGLPSGVTAEITQPGATDGGAVVLRASANAPSAAEVPVTLTASGTGVPSVSATMRLTVVAATPGPVLSLGALQLQFSTTAGRAAALQTLQILNTGGGTMSWAATVTGPFAINPTSGFAPATLTVTPSLQAQAGTYTGTITITAAGAVGSPKTIQLALAVSSGAAFEPQLSRTLEPGFYILEATLAPGAQAGFWGLEVLTSRGQAAGGFNLGGAVAPQAARPGFGGFSLDSRQTVTATVNAQLAGALVTLRFLDSQRRPIGTSATGLSPQSLSQTLDPGFYVVEVYNASATLGTFQLGLAADYFTGGIVTGGQLAPGITGFGAFFVPEAQPVQMKLFGTATYGTAGAGSMILTLRDSRRNVLQVLSPP